MNRRAFLKASSAAALAASRPTSAEADAPSPSDPGYDVMVYGATPGGIAAAVAAARIWRWGGGREILVGFSFGDFVEQEGHNLQGRSDTAAAIWKPGIHD